MGKSIGIEVLLSGYMTECEVDAVGSSVQVQTKP